MDWIEQALSSVFGGAKEASTAPPEAPEKKASPDMQWFPDMSAGGRRAGLKVDGKWAKNEKTPASKPLSNFDTVFNKLVGAESRGVHRTKDGELLTSGAGAQGITQVMPKTSVRPGYGVKPMQDETEGEYLRFGKDYLNAMLKNFGGDMEKAVAAYNAGPRSVSNAVAKAEESGQDWWDHLPKKSETLPYMEKILGKTYAKKR